MKIPRREFLYLTVGAAALPVFTRAAWAQAYPTRPVKVLVPYAPGGPADTLARLIAVRLDESLGQHFFIENQGGGGGNIAMGAAARAVPDGYTIIVVGTAFVVNPSLYAKLPFDPINDFAPITLAATSPNVLVVHPSIAANTVKELIAFLKVNPGKFSYASAGLGTTPHLAGEMFRLSQGLDLVHVPFNGSAPAIQSTLAGHTPIAFTVLTPAVPQVKAGKLRALAVTTPARSPALPDVPTLNEAGISDQESDTLLGILAPAQTPPPIVKLLFGEIAKALASPDVREKLDVLGFEVIVSTPQEFAARISVDIPKWGKVIKDAHIKLEQQ
jgi:tripartite-type tricarboxylate transporter receptor subunit TctC